MAANDNLQVLLVTSTRRDAELIADALQAAGIQSQALETVEAAIEVLSARDVGALLIAEERLDDETVDLLGSVLKVQPAWSALPLLILTVAGGPTLQSRVRERLRWPLGAMTLLERPIRVATLVSSVQAALLARSSPV